jgi:hypothetical protein
MTFIKEGQSYTPAVYVHRTKLHLQDFPSMQQDAEIKYYFIVKLQCCVLFVLLTNKTVRITIIQKYSVNQFTIYFDTHTPSLGDLEEHANGDAIM